MTLDIKELWSKTIIIYFIGRKQVDEELPKFYIETALKLVQSKLLLKENSVKNTIFSIIEDSLIVKSDFIKKTQVPLIK